MGEGVVRDAAVLVIDDGDGGHGRAIGANGGNGKSGFSDFKGDDLRRIDGFAAADAKEHIGRQDVFVFSQSADIGFRTFHAVDFSPVMVMPSPRRARSTFGAAACNARLPPIKTTFS